MLRSVLSTILAAALLTTSAARVSATEPGREGNTFDDHITLLESIERAGVRIYMNTAHCEPKGELSPSGFYVSQSRVMVICQDNGKYDGVVVKPTTNDLDTIRHESQHVVQDCADGIGDNSLVNMFPVVKTEGRVSLGEFVSGSGLSPQTLMHIFTTYTQAGADNKVIGLEFEAFAVANSISAAQITQAVQQVCPIVNNN